MTYNFSTTCASKDATANNPSRDSIAINTKGASPYKRSKKSPNEHKNNRNPVSIYLSSDALLQSRTQIYGTDFTISYDGFGGRDLSYYPLG